jgi:catechol 2,3-dioxygenase-like lactoylglutathione lyase family enzyme
MKVFCGVMRMDLGRAAILLVAAALCQLTLDSGAQRISRPRITGIDHVRLYVSDLARSRDFYAHSLGLATPCPRQDSPRLCFLVDPSQRIELEEARPTPGQQLNNWLAEIGLATDNVRRMHRYLVANGASPGPVLSSSDGSQHFTVRDPEGNSVAFVERPPSEMPSVPAGQIGTRLLHAGFVVSSREAESRFYQNLLGFRLYWRGGFKDEGLDWYEIQVPDGDNWIEYMLNIPAQANHQELGVQNHFSLGVSDVAVAAAQLRANGLTGFDGPEIGRDGKNSLDAYDPDGTRVEVMEFTPRQKPCCADYTRPHPKP